MGSIYKIQNDLDYKVYIGQCKNNPYVRINAHLSGNGSRYIASAVAVHGRENFSYEILHDNVDDDMLSELEIQEIKNNDCLAPDGYNLTHGGEQPRMSDESREMIRVASIDNAKKGLQHPNHHIAWIYASDIADMYIQGNMTSLEIGDVFDANYRTITKILKRYGFDIRGRNHKLTSAAKRKTERKEREKTSPAWYCQKEICDMYTKQKLTVKEISEIVGSNRWIIREILKIHNVYVKDRYKTKDRSIAWEYQEEICVMYLVQNLSPDKICEFFNVSRDVIVRILKHNCFYIDRKRK